MKLLARIALGVLIAHAAWAQNPTAVNNLPTGSAANLGDYTICDQANVTRRCTFAQVLAAVNSANFPLSATNGGTGVAALPANGQLLIGNGAGFALNRITAGAGITVTNGPASITIAATGGGGGCTTANPTGTVGLTAVNGALTTCLASDSAPPLSQAIAPTWTHLHTFTPADNSVGVQVNGEANFNTGQFFAATGAGTSFGPYIQAGTNASDSCLKINNAANSLTYLRCFGDGGFVLNGATGGDQGPGTINASNLYVNGVSVGTSGGTVNTSGSPAANNLAYYTASTTIAGLALGAGQTVQGNAGAPTATRTLQLGASGTPGSLTFGNPTSGLLTLAPVSGALGSVTASFPANSGTVAELNAVQTFTAAQTFSSTVNGSTIPTSAGTLPGSTGAFTTTHCLSAGASSPLQVQDAGQACGTTITIASGTASLGTGAISSATCASAVTASATGVATTDVIGWGFNADPTGVTGYVPLSTGMLTIIAYPTSNNISFKVCNNTTASITPGAITLNWRVTR